MSVAVKNKVAKYLAEALGKPVDVIQYSDDTVLNTLGLDSLLTIDVLVSLLEDCDVDLGKHADSLVTPSTLGDLLSIANRFMSDAPMSDARDILHDRRTQLEYYQVKLAYEIDSADLSAALASGQDLVVVDGRSSEAYKVEHIPGAISIPHKSISQNLLSDLSKSPLYVVYCDGIGCSASTKTAIKLASTGFRVKELIGGLDWWKRNGQTTYSITNQVHGNCGCAVDGPEENQLSRKAGITS